jgi:hypothetical protein
MALPEEQQGMAKMQLLVPIVTQLAGGKLAERKCLSVIIDADL